MKPEHKFKQESFAARLRALRYHLGEDNKPMSGEAFAALVGMSAGRLRAIESGFRGLILADDEKFANRLGARWDEEKKGWFCALAPTIPYSHDIYLLYTEALTQGSGEREMTYDNLSQVLGAVIDSLPDEHFSQSVLAIHGFLRSFARLPGVPPETLEFIDALRPIRIPWLPKEVEQKSKHSRKGRKKHGPPAKT